MWPNFHRNTHLAPGRHRMTSAVLLALAAVPAPGWTAQDAPKPVEPPAAPTTVPFASPATARSVLDSVIETGSLRVCTPADYRPFAHADGDGPAEGLDVDLVKGLAEALPARIEWVRTTWSSLMGDFLQRGCHVAVGGVSVTLERLKKASFSQPYMTNGKTPLVRCADTAKYQTVADIDRPEVRVIANPGGTNEKFARASFPHARLMIHRDNRTIFDEIAEDRADVFVTEAAEARVQQKLKPGLCAVHPEKPLTFGEIGWMLPRDDAPWKAWVDQWLKTQQQTGGMFQSTVDRWLPR